MIYLYSLVAAIVFVAIVIDHRRTDDNIRGEFEATGLFFITILISAAWIVVIPLWIFFLAVTKLAVRLFSK